MQTLYQQKAQAMLIQRFPNSPKRRRPVKGKDASIDQRPTETMDLNPVRTRFLRRMDGLDALAKTRRLGQGMVAGELQYTHLQSVESPDKVLRAAGDVATGASKPIYDVVNNWVANGDDLLPTGSFERMLTQQYGLEQTGQGEVSANYEHHFDMNYGSSGGFRSSESYNTEGKTHLGSVRVLQKPGTPGDGPAAIVIDYDRPGFVGPSLEGTNHDGSSSFQSIYFVPNAAKVKGATGDTHGDDKETKARMEALLKSVEGEAAVELHGYTTGYGRVGTRLNSRVNMGDQVVTPGEHFPHAVAAALDHAIGNTLGIESPPQLEAPAKPSVSAKARAGGALQGALIGGLIAGVGAGAAAALGPEIGIPVVIGGGVLTLISGVSAKDQRDGYYGNRPGSYEAFQRRQSNRFWKGISIGAGLTGTVAAGSFLGVPGVLGVAAVGAIAGGTLLPASQS